MAGGTFPTSVPSYPAISPSETLATAGGGVGLEQLLEWFVDDIEGLATKEGIGSSTPTTPGDILAVTAAGATHFTKSAIGGVALVNGYLAASVGSSALTIAVKTAAGNDPSSSDPVFVVFRSSTAANADTTVLALTAATSVVVSSGSTLGTANSTAFRVWIVAFNDAGTLRMGVINCLSGTDIYPLGGWGIASSTAEGGAGGADSAQVFYTGTAVTSKPYAVLGYATYESGLGTAGTWSAVPTRLHLAEAKTPLPGAVIQHVISASSAVQTGSTQIPADNTIPQNTEGDQYFSKAITPKSAANVLHIESLMQAASSALATVATALFQDSVANALKTSMMTFPGTGYAYAIPLVHEMLAATTSATTFKVRAGPLAVATVTVNGSGGSGLLGATLDSHLLIEEVMA